jgi:hypothetical protein
VAPSAPAARGITVSRPWIVITVLAAALATGLDAVLLERRYGFFTGGFLAVNHLTGPADASRFVVASFLADASMAGLAAGLVLWATSRMRRSAAAGWLLAFAAAVGPLCLANIVSYQLAAYLGDVLNLGLLFDLTGRHVSEVLAVGAAHIGTPLLMAGGGSVVVIGLAWALDRCAPRPAPQAPMTSRALVLPILLLLAGTGVTGMIRHESPVLDNGLRRKPSAQMLGWLSGALTDVDGDGFGWLDSPADPAPWDSRVFPYAIDIPGNGLDEDGIGGDLPVGDTYAEGGPASQPWTSKPDVVLVVLESFRADMVGAIQNGAQVTPVMNGLATAGVSARHAFSHNGYTAQSRHHIFSGSVADLRQGTLIDDFKANGYQVAYFSGQDESFGGPQFGVGFERADVAYDARVDAAKRYSTYSTPGSLAVPFTVVEDRIRDFLATRASRQPLFLYVNFEDTHFPYHHPGVRPILNSKPIAQSDIGPGRKADVRSTYANTAANVDRAIGDVLEMVQRTRGAAPGVIVAADHGESLFDDGVLGHGVGLTDVQTRIPLIVANLPITIEEPIGQAGLRDAIGLALAAPPAGHALPVLREVPDAAVFQYLGILDRPGQIAFTRADRQLIFDFRSGLVRPEGSAEWRDPNVLGEADARAFLHLVRTWERMRLAREHTER